MNQWVYIIVATIIAMAVVYLLFSVFGRKALEAEHTLGERMADDRKKKREVVPPPPTTPAWVVMLLKRPRVIDEDRCRRAAGRAWGRDSNSLVRSLETIVPESQFSVTIEGNEFKVQKQDRPFVLPSGDASYKLVPQPLPSHKAWLSVGLPANVPHDKAYPLLAKYAVELSARDPSHVLLPGTEVLVAYDGDAKSAMQDTDPLLGLRRLVRMGSLTEEEKIAEGGEEARRRWPEFVAAFFQRTEAQKYTVLATIPEGTKREDVWIEVASVREGLVHGKVDVAPLTLSRPRLGEAARVHVHDIQDWVIVEGTRRSGGFTLAKPRKTESEKKRQAMDDDDLSQDSGRITLE